MKCKLAKDTFNTKLKTTVFMLVISSSFVSFFPIFFKRHFIFFFNSLFFFPSLYCSFVPFFLFFFRLSFSFFFFFLSHQPFYIQYLLMHKLNQEKSCLQAMGIMGHMRKESDMNKAQKGTGDSNDQGQSGAQLITRKN
ncbi:hypothetical protein Dimus_038386 [Dionaea muscipula]